ncbi:MAG: formate acetyltransferase [Candidatus Ancillula sp.]|jgi:formate C-acetyltransferase|nr:formate acetyltransferase [Candidatus Ancillula sp.]
MDYDFTYDEWFGFAGTKWRENINVRDFIQNNYTPYDGESTFLEDATEKTKKIWTKIDTELFPLEKERRVLAVEKSIAADVDAFAPGYINDDDDVIVGLQTDQPLKRPIMPYEGWRSIVKALDEIGEEPDAALAEVFTKYARTHNDTVFSLYTERVRACRKSGILSALPDNAARGRTIGDYRRVALYGVDFLIDQKKHDLQENAAEIDDLSTSTAIKSDYHQINDLLQLREEITWQIKSLKDLKSMANKYGCDISRPAVNTKEAVQWLYFGYLGAVKQQDGAAMSVGRIDAFIDCFAQRDLNNGTFDETQIQEIIDNFVIKLRLVRFLRMEAFDEMYTGDPIWATVSIGGVGADGRSMVSKTSFRLLQTLRNLGPSPEPNLTVLYSARLSDNFKDFCAGLSIETSTIQYENDELIRTRYNDDTAISCCVSPVPKSDGIESQQLFGARMNGAKALLYGLNGGRDDLTGEQVFKPGVVKPFAGEILDYDKVWEYHFKPAIWHLTEIYVEALNCIHYSHDRCFYESLELALHDTKIGRTMGCGLAGLSHIVDSLSAIKYAKVRPVRNVVDLIVDYAVDGEFPTFGNDDDRADSIAKRVVAEVDKALRAQVMYRNATPTLSLLTITANVEYGKKTGNMPDGRRSGTPFAPGANPSNGVDQEGVVASMASVGKLEFDKCRDGISLTTTILPTALGETREQQSLMLVRILDKMFSGVKNADYSTMLYHSNINVLTRELLQEAFEDPDNPKFNNLCVRISGYCVRWQKLTQEQRLDILDRTFHKVS